ncbi:hypothetical protein MRS44_005362 [Fusarium solani]|uniref:uncharacterized protein n=1 Tax=Fusarium solani TaxID=169388 RepID=UPI0032C4900B|nr:hypothetical protein MRS44_005362 [Fusarium solani]
MRLRVSRLLRVGVVLLRVGAVLLRVGVILLRVGVILPLVGVVPRARDLQQLHVVVAPPAVAPAVSQFLPWGLVGCVDMSARSIV